MNHGFWVVCFRVMSVVSIMGAAQAASQPNIVLFLCDDLGWADLPCYGQQMETAHGGWSIQGDLKMPHLDRFARESTRFLRFYVNGAVCFLSTVRSHTRVRCLPSARITGSC